MTVFPAVAGLSIRGSATAFPCDVSAAPELDNAAVFRWLEQQGQGVEADQAEDLVARLGVSRRQWAQEPGAGKRYTGVREMGIEAGRRALADAGLTAEALDYVLVSCSTPERITQCLAAKVANGLGAACGSADVRAGGAGGLVAWLQAVGLLQLGLKRVLVIATEAGARFVRPSDAAGVLLYADGAAAIVVERDGSAGGLLGAVSGTFAAPGEAFTVEGRLPPAAGVDPSAYWFDRPDKAYLVALSEQWQRTSVALNQRLGGAMDGVTHFVPYPVTPRQISEARAALARPDVQLQADVSRHGVTGSAGALIGLHEGRGAPRTMALTAVAGGVCWAGLVWKEGR